MRNRLANQTPEPGQKFVIIQTPMGQVKIALPGGTMADGEDPVAIALGTFQAAVDRGVEDPLAETITNLKAMAENGKRQPLLVGLAILNEMSAGGMLPPLQTVLEGTGVTPEEVAKALKGDSVKPTVFEKLDDNIEFNN